MKNWVKEANRVLLEVVPEVIIIGLSEIDNTMHRVIWQISIKTRENCTQRGPNFK